MLTWLICSRVDNGEEDERKKEKRRKIILMRVYLFHAVHCLNSAKLIPLSLPTKTSSAVFGHIWQVKPLKTEH